MPIDAVQHDLDSGPFEHHATHGDSVTSSEYGTPLKTLARQRLFTYMTVVFLSR